MEAAGGKAAERAVGPSPRHRRSTRSQREALKHAKQRGRESEYSYRNSDGNKVRFQFVGVMDLMSLGIEAGADEVWYEIRERLTPLERRKKILPEERELLARPFDR